MFVPSGESGIRTHAPFRTNGFQDRLVMTTSISLQMCFSILQDQKHFVKNFFHFFNFHFFLSAVLFCISNSLIIISRLSTYVNTFFHFILDFLLPLWKRFKHPFGGRQTQLFFPRFTMFPENLPLTPIPSLYPYKPPLLECCFFISFIIMIHTATPIAAEYLPPEPS